MNTHPSPNRLVHENSPYLLQHAYNPVDWYPWNQEALEKAQQEDKPILVSIGYSACHWCHVMERESFENKDIAKLMNERFVCIKVDREERPDVDQIYMEAIQAMGLHGGWPLNVFLMPDTKPFYGGTYFPPQHWAKLLQQIAGAYEKNRTELEDSAHQFAQVINHSELERYGLGPNEEDFTRSNLAVAAATLKKHFDTKKGGMGRAPKFPMPGIYLFLLRYYHLAGDREALAQVELTLREMACGGIYDQVGGGFARYSVDDEWFAPHFEKMLYDNGQLVSLYSEAYMLTGNPLYKEVVYQTIEFVKRELTTPEGGFYAALDADSEGEEGKFYVWTADDLDDLEDAELIKAYYNATHEGNWEHGYNILHRRQPDEEFAAAHQLSLEELQQKVKEWQKTMLTIRSLRERPGLDDKVLAGWNGLMLKGLSDAYSAFGEPAFLELARANAEFIVQNVITGNQLFRNYKNGKATIPGYLEDYAAVIQGYIALYQVSFDEKWLHYAHILTREVLEHFYDEQEGMFFFTDDRSEKLIARKKELMDNVIPASNSIMATNLYWMSLFFDQHKYREIADRMLLTVMPLLKKEVRYLSNWASLYTYRLSPTVEVAIVGTEYREFRREIAQQYFPNKIMTGTESESELPLLEMRTASGDKTTVYVCRNKACLLPVHSVKEALEQIRNE